MRVLTVLMWHHLLVRQRRFLVTTFELITPMLYFLVLFLCRKYLPDVQTTKNSTGELNLNIHNTEAIRLNDTRPLSLVLYYPSTQLTDILMDAVGKKLHLNRLQSFPDPKSRGYYALNDSSSLEVSQLIKEMRDNSAIVQFSDMDGAQYPPTLNYTIRMNVDFMTQIYKSLDDDIGPHERFGTIYEPFLRLQWSIDSSYIKMRTNGDVDRELYLQELPFVDSRVNPYAVTLTGILDLLCTWALFLPYVFLMQRLMQYRQSGLEELIKMVGVTPAIFRLSHFINMLPCCLVFAVSASIFLKVSSHPLLLETNIFLIFIMLTLHFLTLVLIAFVFSHVTQSNQYSISLAIVSFITIRIICNVVTSYVYKIPRLLRPISGLLPLVPLSVFWKTVGYHEQFGEGVTFANLFEDPIEIFAPIVCFIAVIVQAVLLSGLAWYVALVRPGKYGVALPVGFLFKRSYWVKKVSPREELALVEEAEPIVKDPRLFEPVQHQTEVGIKINDVTKVYDKKRVLSNVSLDVYKSEITVLLGHNGAGKTTLMSVITGMTSMTSGSVFVNGASLSAHPARVRRELGLCPQHNLTVPYLTVLQQVIFFARLKGEHNYKEAKRSSKKLLEQLGLESKLDSLADQLSGGMKRRLQLACALAGGSTVLILDEPTSGLDVETRRELWDLLLSLRGQHTVLLTTHFMEEADALGDRVAALHGGVLRCHATPMFLKKSIGTGYRLSLTTAGLPKVDKISSAITNVVPRAMLKEKSYNSITYTLPSQDSDKFPALFSSLEKQRSKLYIESIGVGVSTLEDVFLKLCSDIDTQFSADTVDTNIPEPTHLTKKGPAHYLLVTGLLMLRQFRYLLHNIFVFMFVQIIIPIGLLAIYTLVIKMGHEGEEAISSTRQAMDLNLYPGITDKRILYRGPKEFSTWVPKYNDVNLVTTQDNVTTTVINASLKKIADYDKYIAGIELNKTHAKVLYTTAVRHAAPVALNILSNMLASVGTPNSTVATYNDPLRSSTLIQPCKPLDKVALVTWVVVVVCVYVGALTSAPALAVAERRLGTRHIHVMAGCPPALHWLATLAAHTLVYAAGLIAPLCVLTLIDTSHTISEPAFIGTLAVILLTGTTAWLAVTYLVHFITNAVSLVLSLIMIIFGVAPAVVIASMAITGISVTQWWVKWPCHFLNYVSPAYTMSAAMVYAVSIASDNAFCNLNIGLCPKQLNENFLKCCEKGMNPNCYLCMGDLTPMNDVIIMIVQSIVYMLLVILSEYGLFGKLWDSLVNASYRHPTSRFRDPMVLAEKTYVEKAIALPKDQITDAMLVSDLHKSYFRCRQPCKPFQAVKGVSFSVKKGECFGLLGVNGAGKSTTFKMITAEVEATRGRCFANSHHLKWARIPYMQSLGYCPQFFGMDEFMTGRNNLKLLLTLRGMRPGDIDAEVNAWIAVAGLERYADVCVSAYSGGCARRLAAASALATGAAVTLLDEPTSGVDVAARRRVWLAVRKGLRNQRAVVLTSHSMDEMEALCDRIAIMAGGELAALGSAPALRAAHAAGHAVALKVRPATPPASANTGTTATATADVTDGGAAPDPLVPLKRAVQERFTCRLTDEHKTMLHYHVQDSVRYSELFQALEDLKRAFPDVIEDYSVSETTLEEAFLSFAQPSGGRAEVETSPA